MNAFAKRWVFSLKEECLNQLVVFGLRNLRRVVMTYAEYLNERRPHQGIENRLPKDILAGRTDATTTDGPFGKIDCEELLGGLLKSYSRESA